MKKRSLVALLALLLVIGLIGACTPAPAATPADTAAPAPAESAAPAPEATPVPEKVTLKIGIWPEDTMTDEIKLHEGYVETFMATHPGVEVVPPITSMLRIRSFLWRNPAACPQYLNRGILNLRSSLRAAL